ncbi:hypothetical protein PsorP6_015314 [Peronosclerospora sorghi]|uniref:Uncharacterized protein n=1 Tax=Peronosclerospora sorghi TaxID=230839 RepID=A0ACC0VVS0_9STRA|nr:hypothetical protein PsorP6_015314 [Peronosclerospora sorghi]
MDFNSTKKHLTLLIKLTFPLRALINSLLKFPCHQHITTKMQVEPPVKDNDVKLSVGDGDVTSQGVDSNGIVVGRWKTGIFGFTDSMVPNGTS